MRSWSKCVIFSRRWKSSRREGPALARLQRMVGVGQADTLGRGEEAPRLGRRLRAVLGGLASRREDGWRGVIPTIGTWHVDSLHGGGESDAVPDSNGVPRRLIGNPVYSTSRPFSPDRVTGRPMLTPKDRLRPAQACSINQGVPRSDRMTFVNLGPFRTPSFALGSIPLTNDILR